MPNFELIRDLVKLRQGFLPFLVQAWKEKGDLFSMSFGSRKMVFAVHPDDVKYITAGIPTIYNKEHTYDVPRKYLLGNGLVTSNGELWKRQRRLMAPFFTPTNIQSFIGIMIHETQTLAERWTTLATKSEPVEILDEMMLVAAHIILKTMFSSEKDVALEVGASIDYLLDAMTKRSTLPFRIPDVIPTPGNRKYIREKQRVRNYIDTLIQERRQLPEAQWPDDMLARLMKAEENEQHMSEAQIVDECITIFTAGHETTARTMTFTWYALSRNPAVEAKLHHEIDTVLGDQPLTMELMKQMPYALQVIKETLRLYPAAPLYTRDAVVDNQLGSLKISQGTPVILSPFLTHRHPDFWDDPETFDPDRWLPEAEKARHPFAYHPFAAGQRVCIGNNFSLLESHIMLTMLARHFAPRLSPADHVAQLEIGGTLHSKNGMPMVIVPRKTAQIPDAQIKATPLPVA